MLQRIANLVLGAVILFVAASSILLHLTSAQPFQAWVLLFGVALAVGAGCIWAGAVAIPRRERIGPVLPAAGSEAAWRLREMKRSAPSRYPGLKGLAALAPWKL